MVMMIMMIIYCNLVIKTCCFVVVVLAIVIVTVRIRYFIVNLLVCGGKSGEDTLKDLARMFFRLFT